MSIYLDLIKAFVIILKNFLHILIKLRFLFKNLFFVFFIRLILLILILALKIAIELNIKLVLL